MKTRLWLVAAILPALALAAGVSYRDVSGTVVSADATSNMLTIKTEEGATSQSKVEGDASATLGTLRSGDKVVVTMKDSGTGEPAAVTAITKSAQ